MRIQHNIMAMNAYRNFNNNTSALSSNLEKLSSGYRINRAGDDAAGLAISEKMRAQITGLDAAQKNVQDGISLVKTAEGALQEVQDMMNRMVYLAEQSANGTYDDKVDRAALQDEVNSLATEINRIGTTANFNGKKLLDGSLASIKLQIGDSADANNSDQLDMAAALGETLKVVNFSAMFDTDTMVDLTDTSTDATALANSLDNISNATDGTAPSGVVVNIMDEGTALKAIQLLKGNGANDEKALINIVSSYRAKLGASQNRLEHTAKNLSVMEENIANAESAIRDTDIADEMTAYTKNNILLQSAQAMLAQANQVPQGVLQLLQ